jgi:hypothetical protein
MCSINETELEVCPDQSNSIISETAFLLRDMDSASQPGLYAQCE